MKQTHMIDEAAGNPACIRWAERRKWDTKSRLLASVDRARELIGYNPSASFNEGLQHTIQWFRDNWDRIEASARFGSGVSAAVREVATVTR